MKSTHVTPPWSGMTSSQTRTMNVFKEPPTTEWNVLNLGAGVQSSALALMAAHGEVTPTPDFAVFADTQAEPTEVYDWLETLQTLINAAPHPFPVYTVTHGDLTAEQLLVRTREKDTPSGGKKGSTYIKRIIPVFGLHKGEMTAALGRKCTSDFKVAAILKEVKKRCGIKRGQKEVTVTQWIGISWDEIQRARETQHQWTQSRWPLLETKTNRIDCIKWMIDNGYPIPPRSACYYCPFHDDGEWRRMRDEDPEHFQKAVDFDKQLRQQFKDHDAIMQMEVFLHRSCKPLDQVDFDNDEDKGQTTFDFQSECEGMCGV